MIEVPATVVGMSGKRLRVRLDTQQGGCGRCNEPGGCGSARLSELFGPTRNEFELTNSIDAHSGDPVLLCIAEGASLKAALVGYGLPVLLVIAGAAIGTALSGSGAEDLFALGGAAIGIGLALPLGRRMRRRAGWSAGIELRRATDGKVCSH